MSKMSIQNIQNIENNIISSIEEIYLEISTERNIRYKSRLILEMKSLLEELKLTSYNNNNNRKELLNYYNLYTKKLNELLLLDEKTNNLNNSSLVNTENKSLQELQKARLQLLETVDVATEINTNLELQGEKIKKVQHKTKQIDTELDHSNSVLRKMLRWWRS